MKIILLAFTCLTLGGCAVIDAAECRNANWFDLGMRDGLAGMQRTDTLYEHQCAQQGIRPDVTAYASGWQDGHWEFERRSVRDSTD